MTIETQTNRATYVGNGVATKFPFPGVLRDASSIRLFLWADNRQTEMTTGFSVIGVGSSAVYVQTAQPIPAGVKLTILRQVPYVQPMDLINGGEFSAEVIEGSDDNLELQIQQMVEMLGRAIVAPESMDKGEVTYETLIEILEDAEAARDDAQAAAESADESEAMAQKWAANPEDLAVQGDLFSSFHYSRKANASATAAAAEAVKAATAKDQAAQAAVNAAIAKDQAAQAAVNAATAKNQAAQAAADARAEADRLEASMDEVESAFALLEPGVWNSCLCALKRANAAVIGETSKMRVLRRIYEV